VRAAPKFLLHTYTGGQAGRQNKTGFPQQKDEIQEIRFSASAGVSKKATSRGWRKYKPNYGAKWCTATTVPPLKK
jgi:hypothetical protein